ncbi:hypothetical protein ACA910_020162 [Epithemia clementina (nom. ined.)]
MVLEASALLEHENVDPIAHLILSFISKLDDWGARTVNLLHVGAVTFVILLSIRVSAGKYRGVEWYALLHALVSGIGAVMATYLDVYASEALTGVPEPLRSCQCQGPLTSLHRFLPAITMGYATFDFFDGLTLGIDFAMHGAATLLVMVVYVVANAPQLVTPMLLMEVSTINLTMVRADFFPDVVSLLNQLSFAFFFMLFRIIICPYLWFKLMLALHSEHNTEAYCFAPALYPLAGIMGVFFHCLNGFWFYKILRKMKRKLMGDEGIKANNDLNDSDKKRTKANEKKAKTQ